MQKFHVTFVDLPEEMENSSAQPSTSAAVSSEREPSCSPPDEPVWIKPTSNMQKFHVTFVDLPEEMENSSAQPSTSAAVSSEREPSCSPPDEPVWINPTRSFNSLYEVGNKLASGSHGTVHEGIRRSDNKPVIIKFVKKRRFDFHIGQFEPLCREAAMMRIMKHCDHVMDLYDWFDEEDRNILTMEHPGTNMTLCDFVKENGGRLSEAEAKDILQRIITALQHCSVQGVYFKDISLRKVFVDKDTKEIKLTGFYRALTDSERPISARHAAEFKSKEVRAIHASMVANKGLYRVLKGMVKGKLWFCWRNTLLSRECQDLLRKLRDRESDITLQNIMDHDWFNNTPHTEALESDGRGVKGDVRTLFRKVCPCVAALRPSEEERPHTPGLEPMVDYAEPSTSAAGSGQVCPHTPGQDPTPAAGAPETEPHTRGQDPTPAAGAPETEPHTRGKEPTQRGADSVETTDLTLMFPNDLNRQKEYFRSLYVVGRKLKNKDLVRTGIRRSNNKKVIIKFVTRSRCPKEIDKPVRDGELLMEMQKAPTCDHIIRLYDRFITEQSCILITEYLPAYATFDKFLEMYEHCLIEQSVKRIIRQIILLMHHCMDRGFFFDVCEKWILIHPITMKIKLLDFDVVIFTRNEEDHALTRKILFSTHIMRHLISLIRYPSGEQGFMSSECQDLYKNALLRKTRGCERRCSYNLENILDHPWFIPRVYFNSRRGIGPIISRLYP